MAAQEAPRTLLLSADGRCRTMDTQTHIECDGCGRGGWAVFYEMCSARGAQLVVWWGYPAGWLMFLDETRSPVFACSKECATAVALGRYPHEFDGTRIVVCAHHELMPIFAEPLEGVHWCRK